MKLFPSQERLKIYLIIHVILNCLTIFFLYKCGLKGIVYPKMKILAKVKQVWNKVKVSK